MRVNSICRISPAHCTDLRNISPAAFVPLFEANVWINVSARMCDTFNVWLLNWTRLDLPPPTSRRQSGALRTLVTCQPQITPRFLFLQVWINCRQASWPKWNRQISCSHSLSTTHNWSEFCFAILKFKPELWIVNEIRTCFRLIRFSWERWLKSLCATGLQQCSVFVHLHVSLCSVSLPLILSNQSGCRTTPQISWWCWVPNAVQCLFVFSYSSQQFVFRDAGFRFRPREWKQSGLLESCWPCPKCHFYHRCRIPLWAWQRGHDADKRPCLVSFSLASLLLVRFPSALQQPHFHQWSFCSEWRNEMRNLCRNVWEIRCFCEKCRQSWPFSYQGKTARM